MATSNPELAKRSAEVLARLSGGGQTRGAIKQRGTCTKCGGEGHLTFQCTNYLKFEEEGKVRKTRQRERKASTIAVALLPDCRTLVQGSCDLPRVGSSLLVQDSIRFSRLLLLCLFALAMCSLDSSVRELTSLLSVSVFPRCSGDQLDVLRVRRRGRYPSRVGATATEESDGGSSCRTQSCEEREEESE